MLKSQALIVIRVDGEPLPKQSYRALKSGGGYRDGRVTKWQNTVTKNAREVMDGCAPLAGALEVSIAFWRKNNARVDVDNLSKAILDALNNVVWRDDQQVRYLHLAKFIDPLSPGVVIEVAEVEE